jgi:hypothetical protein
MMSALFVELDFAYSDEQDRGSAVHPAAITEAITEAMRVIHQEKRILEEQAW